MTAETPLALPRDNAVAAPGLWLGGELLGVKTRTVRPRKGETWEPFERFMVHVLVDMHTVAVEYRYQDAAEAAAAELSAGRAIPVAIHASDGNVYHRGRKVAA
jgi:hypothetical protein